MRTDFLDIDRYLIDRYLIEGHQAGQADPVDIAAVYSPQSTGMAWVAAAVIHWRKGLAALVAVLVLSGVAANATSPTQPTGSILAAAWTPASECARIQPSDLKPGHFRATMRWCPYTAAALHEGEVRGKWEWETGDLTRLMALFSCESGGNPRAKNPSSSASGLGQFLNGTWNRWAPRAAAFYGFDNPNRFMGYDSILTTVYLAKVDSFSHWRCWRRYTA